jgi:predicted amidohydrolase YtcJ
MWKLARDAQNSVVSSAASGFLLARRVKTLATGQQGDALWWENGRIRAVGSARELGRQVSREIPRFEFPEALVTPGLVDGHTHFALWALSRRRVQLAGCRTREDALARVAKARPVQGWIIGQGWDANDWKTPPDRHALDAVQVNPVYLDSLDVHAAWVNSAALATAGITRDTPDPYGGRIVRDAVGEPTGLLLERAVELLLRHLPEPPDDVLDEALREAQAEAHQLGLTGIHNVEAMPVLAAFRRMADAGSLRLRVLFHPPVAALPELIHQELRSGVGTEWLTIGGIKLFLDGSLGSRTAWMLQPFEGTKDRGMPLSTEAEARDAVTHAAEHGIASTVHAIGDAAVRRALDLLSVLPRVGVPHRIEHFQCVHPDDLGRAAAAGIFVSMQPAHLLTDIPLVDRHWGQRGRGAYAFRSLFQRHTPIVFGSDVPVASIDPREGIFAALERQAADGSPRGGWRPEEKLGFEEALRGYTTGAAAAGGVAARRGTLAPGQDADLVVWDVDPAVEQGDGTAFRAARAILTVIGGSVVMRQ